MVDDGIALLNQTNENDKGHHVKNVKDLAKTTEPPTALKTQTKQTAKPAAPKNLCFVLIYRGIYKLWQLSFALISLHLSWSDAQYNLYGPNLVYSTISAAVAILMMLSLAYHSGAYQRKTYSFKATAKYEILLNAFCFLLHFCCIIIYLVANQQFTVPILPHLFALLFFVPVFVFEYKYLKAINGYGVTFAKPKPELAKVFIENQITVIEEDSQQEAYNLKGLQEVTLKDPKMIELIDQFLIRATQKDEKISEPGEISGKKEEQKVSFNDGDLADKRNKL